MAVRIPAFFIPTRNSDGSRSSLCTTCGDYVGAEMHEPDLRLLEKEHVCSERVAGTAVMSDANVG
jgi:hypothetical protein